MNIILFGPPGAGKGTQAKYLKNKLNNYQVSTGDILRDEIKKETEIGKKIISCMNDGKFVDDEIINKLIKKIIFDKQKKNKLIFDGYPRTLEQAKNLNSWLTDSDQKIDFIFFLNVNKNIIIERIKKRKIIEKRSDDNLETFIKRYDTYMETTKPVLDYYSIKPNFNEIDGGLKITEITNKINSFLEV
ncbi:adenylate kinase [Candidatus Pelagibacter communis]|uniref:adenylate kinase n=1 Tax=Pelagibacter ubique TaxID=198252 RepID=UPI00094CA307|nr:adenylate kinase [Candidatus Pelagibacter ubique]